MSTPSVSIGAPTQEVQAALMVPPATSKESYVEQSVRSAAVIGSRGFADDEGRRRAIAAEQYDRDPDPSGTARQLLAIFCSPDRTPACNRLDIPALVIHGTIDPLVQPDGGKATAAAIDGRRAGPRGEHGPRHARGVVERHHRPDRDPGSSGRRRLIERLPTSPPRGPDDPQEPLPGRRDSREVPDEHSCSTGFSSGPTRPPSSRARPAVSCVTAELYDDIRRLAGGLASRGFGPGDVLAIMAPNMPEYAVLFHGAAMAGGTVTTINPTYTTPRSIINSSTPGRRSW